LKNLFLDIAHVAFQSQKAQNSFASVGDLQNNRFLVLNKVSFLSAKEAENYFARMATTQIIAFRPRPNRSLG
jgi:hypothetical protein